MFSLDDKIKAIMGINPYERELSQAQTCCFLKTVQLNSNVHDFRLDGPG